MLSRNDLLELVEWKARPGQAILSVYLDVDQARSVNLNRGFERTLKSLLRSLGQELQGGPALPAFEIDARRVTAFVADYRPTGQSLCLFSDAAREFFWQRQLRTPIANAVFWDDLPHMRPLLEVLEEFERYGVILADRAHARLFTVFMGEIQEQKAVFASPPVHSTVTTGTDHIWSQKDFQRRADVHAYWFLKGVAEAMERLAALHAFDRLILAGPVEATTELHRVLSKRLRSRVVRSLSLAVDSDAGQVLEATLPICQAIDRAAQEEEVEDLITAAAKDEQAVAGLAALRQGRVWRLLYAASLASPGWRCGTCASLFTEAAGACPYCGGDFCPIEDLVEEAAQQVFRAEGKVERVRGSAASRLGALGGIGAHLRY